MLNVKYPRPITEENLPDVAVAFARLKRKIRRRKIIGFFCGALCFLLHTALMILASVGLYHHFAGARFAAVLDGLPYVKPILDFCFGTLPERIGLTFQIPELLAIPAAVIVPPLLCMALAMLMRLVFAFFGKIRRPEEVNAAKLAEEARVLSEKNRFSRKANWTMLSGVLSLLAFAGAVVYSLYVVRPASDEWDVKFLFSYIFIGIIAFSAFQLVATLTDTVLELLCGFDTQWEDTRLISDLLSFLASKNAPARKTEPAPPTVEEPAGN